MKELTPRQQQILELRLDGMKYRELAATMGIAPGTVNPHLKAIARNLGADGFSRSALRDAWAARQAQDLL